MPLPGAPPNVLPTTAMVLPSAESFTRYQLSTAGMVFVLTAGSTTSLNVVPLSMERNSWPSCDAATMTVPSAELSIERHGRFCVLPADTGNVGADQVAPESLLIT